jgi:hypothetical protein
MTDAQVMARDQRGTRGSLKSFFDPSVVVSMEVFV